MVSKITKKELLEKNEELENWIKNLLDENKLLKQALLEIKLIADFKNKTN